MYKVCNLDFLVINKNKNLYKMELVKGGVRVTKKLQVGFEVLQSTDINGNIISTIIKWE